MKRLLFKAVAVWVALCPIAQFVMAQNAQFEFPSEYTGNSLIREYNDSVDIIYNYDGKASFLYADRLNATFTMAQLQTPIEVSDRDCG